MGIQENNLRIKTERQLTPWQRLWRINSGRGWIGKVLSRKDGAMTLLGAQPFYGAPEGFPDMVGFDSIVITPDMVGKRVAVFVGTELKATKKDKLKVKQKHFRDLLIKMGGIHREVREDGSVIESTVKITNK